MVNQGRVVAWRWISETGDLDGGDRGVRGWVLEVGWAAVTCFLKTETSGLRYICISI